MSGWAPGDLAWCVNARALPSRRMGARRELVEGRCYSVLDVGPDGSITGEIPCLFLDGIRSGAPLGGYAQVRFRKIKPLTTEETREFIADLQDGKPVPVEV